MHEVFSEKNPWDGELWNHGGDGNIKQKTLLSANSPDK